MANEPADARGDGFFDALRNSAAIKELRDETRGIAYAHATRIVGKVGDSITDTTDRLSKAGEKTGQRPASGRGEARLNPGAVAERTGSLWRAAARRARRELNNLRRVVAAHDKGPGERRGERAGPVTKSSEPPRQARATKAEPGPAAKKAQSARATKAEPGPAAKKAQSARATKAQPGPAAKKAQSARATKTRP
jgi:hypothetical protein